MCCLQKIHLCTKHILIWYKISEVILRLKNFSDGMMVKKKIQCSDGFLVMKSCCKRKKFAYSKKPVAVS